MYSLQYRAINCSFYHTRTHTAAARNESNAGLILSIGEEEDSGLVEQLSQCLPLVSRIVFITSVSPFVKTIIVYR